MHIVQALRSKKVFGALPPFRILSTWANWIVCLKAIFGIPMEDQEFEVYRRFTGRTSVILHQVRKVLLVIGRRGGKSIITSVIAVFLLVFVKWPLGLEKGYVMVIAVDRRQAGVVFNYVRRILELPFFRNLVVNVLKEEIELRNGMVFSVQTANFRSLRGYQACAVIIDEAAFLMAEGASPLKEIITGLEPSLGAMPGSLMILISTGYQMAGPVYETCRENYGRDDPDMLVWMAGTRDMNPGYDQGVIDRALKEDYAAASVEYGVDGNFFRADLEGFLSVEALDAVVVPGRSELPPMRGASYSAAVDPSGGRGDSMVLSVVHVEKENIVQDCLRIVRPPFNPADVVGEFAKTLREYGIQVVTGDKYSANWNSSSFEREGISYRNAERSASESYLEFLPIVMRRGCELLDHRQMLAEFRALLRRTGRGRDIVDHPPSGHDDIANATALSIVAAAASAAGGVPVATMDLDVSPEDGHGAEDYWAMDVFKGIAQGKLK